MTSPQVNKGECTCKGEEKVSTCLCECHTPTEGEKPLWEVALENSFKGGHFPLEAVKKLMAFQLEQAEKRGYEKAMTWTPEKERDFKVELIGMIEREKKQAREEVVREIRKIPLVFKYGEVSRAIEFYAKEKGIPLK